MKNKNISFKERIEILEQENKYLKEHIKMLEEDDEDLSSGVVMWRKTSCVFIAATIACILIIAF